MGLFRPCLSVIVASMGRSASTVLMRALLPAVAGPIIGLSPRLTRHMVQRWQTDLTTLTPRPGRVYKTHDRPVAGLPDYVRTIYTFADPFEVVASLHRQWHTAGEVWMREHATNMVRREVDYVRMYDTDVLELEANFDAWMQHDGPRCLLVRYDELWNQTERLSAFLGRPVRLPPYQPRASALDQLDRDQRAAIERTYRGLRDKVLAVSIVER